MNDLTQKKSSPPSEPGSSSANSQTLHKNENYKNILHQFVLFFKSLNKKTVLFMIGVGLFIIAYIFQPENKDNASELATTSLPAVVVATDAAATMTPQPQTVVKRYELTDEERWELASVVTAEAGGEPYLGMVAVAQCILQACEDSGLRPYDVFIKYNYSPHRPEPTEETQEAVKAVFDLGIVASEEPIKYFYAPALVESEWHESQIFIIEIGGHRFFKEAPESE